MSVIEPHNNDKLQYIFDNARVGIAICNAEDNTLEMVNPAFAAIHGYEPHELIGASPGEVFAPECMLRLSEYESAPSCAINDVSFETTHIRKDGSLVPVSVHITVIKNKNGVVKQRIANIIDISERKKTESELQITHERFAQIYDNSTDVIYLIEVTPEGRFIHLDINPAFVEVSGMARDAIVGRYVDEIEYEPFRNILLDKYNSCLNAGEKTDYTNDYPLPAGIQTFHSVLTPLFDEKGRIHQIVGIARDITEQKRMESALEARELEFRNLAENSPNIIMRYDLECRRIYVNQAFAEHTGITVDEAVNTMPSEKWNMRMLSMSAEEYQAKIKHVIETGEEAKFEADWYRLSDGGFVALDIHIVAQRDARGNVIGALAIGHDVTERKQMESALEAQERKFRSLAENIPDNIARWDTEGRYLYINPTHERLLGMTCSEAIGTFIPDTHTNVKAAIAQVAATGEKITISQTALVDGNIEYHEVSIAPEQDESGNIVTILGIGRNLTEYKYAEQRLQQALELNEELINTIPDLLFELDAEGTYLNIWAQDETLLSAQKAILIGNNVRDILPPDAVEVTFQTIREVDSTGQSLGNTMYLDLPEGKKWFELSASKKKSSGTYIVLSREITERKEQEQQLQKTRAKLSAVISTIPDLIWVKDNNGTYLMCNPAVEQFFSVSHEQFIGKTDYDFMDTDTANLCRQSDLEAVAANTVTLSYEPFIFPDSGAEGIWEIRKIPVSMPNGESMGILGIARDITEHHQLQQAIQENEKRLKEAQKIAKVGSWELEFPSYKLQWSDEIYRIFEIDQNQFQPSYEYFLNAIHPDDRDYLDTVFNDSIKNKTPYDFVHRLLMRDGRIKYVHEIGQTTYDAKGNPIRSIGTVQDITERKSIEKKMHHMAHHDALTGLPNRTLAKERANQIMVQAKRAESKAAFLFIDLDGFKAINDTLGHSVGDLMLKSVSSRLKDSLRESDALSRQGGDEFLLILSGIQNKESITSIAEKILAELEKPFEINTHTLSLSGSIGIALYPDHGETFEALLQSADTAMYKAKESGKNGYHFYTQQMTHHMIGQFKIQNDLKNALENNEFILFYQPQIDLATHRIIGVEALIRWQHPMMGMMPPMSFIPIAENSGLIVQIGQWVIEESCRQVALWQEMGIDISVAVNISAMQFKRGNLEEIVINALQNSQINPKWLELELTESIIMHDADKTLQSVRNLKALGVQLSIDDFGTGYSSLSYLKRFAVDKLKIDQSFVRDILQDRDDAAIVKTIIQMAKNLNLTTIAEGVENQEVLSVIQDFGCDEVQGYHFAKPMPSGDFELYHTNFYAKG